MNNFILKTKNKWKKIEITRNQRNYFVLFIGKALFRSLNNVFRPGILAL